MKAHEYTVEPPAIEMSALATRGWAMCQISAGCEQELQGQLLSLAKRLGIPTATRTGGDLCDALTPTTADSANRRSLSKIHSVGEFPLHADTAHWLKPCRYIVLACVSPGNGDRPTFFLDTKQLPLTEQQTALLHSTPFRVTNGRNSFFSTILSKARPFVRFDPGCMTPATIDGTKALTIFAQDNWQDLIEIVRWQRGMIAIIDNWRLLHGRARADYPDPERKLMRISIR